MRKAAHALWLRRAAFTSALVFKGMLRGTAATKWDGHLGALGTFEAEGTSFTSDGTETGLTDKPPPAFSESVCRGASGKATTDMEGAAREGTATQTGDAKTATGEEHATEAFSTESVCPGASGKATTDTEGAATDGTATPTGDANTATGDEHATEAFSGSKKFQFSSGARCRNNHSRALTCEVERWNFFKVVAPTSCGQSPAQRQPKPTSSQSCQKFCNLSRRLSGFSCLARLKSRSHTHNSFRQTRPGSMIPEEHEERRLHLETAGRPSAATNSVPRRSRTKSHGREGSGDAENDRR